VGNVQQPALGDGTYTLFYVGKGSGHPLEAAVERDRRKIWVLVSFLRGLKVQVAANRSERRKRQSPIPKRDRKRN